MMKNINIFDFKHIQNGWGEKARKLVESSPREPDLALF